MHDQTHYTHSHFSSTVCTHARTHTRRAEPTLPHLYTGYVARMPGQRARSRKCKSVRDDYCVNVLQACFRNLFHTGHAQEDG